MLSCSGWSSGLLSPFGNVGKAGVKRLEGVVGAERLNQFLPLANVNFKRLLLLLDPPSVCKQIKFFIYLSFMVNSTLFTVKRWSYINTQQITKHWGTECSQSNSSLLHYASHNAVHPRNTQQIVLALTYSTRSATNAILLQNIFNKYLPIDT